MNVWWSDAFLWMTCFFPTVLHAKLQPDWEQRKHPMFVFSWKINNHTPRVGGVSLKKQQHGCFGRWRQPPLPNPSKQKVPRVPATTRKRHASPPNFLNALFGSSTPNGSFKSWFGRQTIFTCELVYMGVEPKIGGKPPKIFHFNGVFHYKPFILGYPYFWKHHETPIYIPEKN